MAGNDMKVNPQLTAQVRAQLLANPAFLGWQQGVGNAVADPGRFGLTGLPKNAWIDKQGNVQTTDESWPWKPFVELVGSAATAGTLGAALAGGSTLAGGAILGPPASLATTAGGVLPAAAIAGPITTGAVAPLATAGTVAATTGTAGAGMKLSDLWGTLIGKGADTALGLYGAHGQQQSNQAAADALAASNAANLKLLTDTEAERKREWELQQQQLKEAWDAEQARRAPYRQAGQGALISLSQFAGLPAPTTAITAPAAAPPPGWAPGQASTSVPINSLLPSPFSAGLQPTAPFAAVGPTPARRVVNFPSYGA